MYSAGTPSLNTTVSNCTGSSRQSAPYTSTAGASASARHAGLFGQSARAGDWRVKGSAVGPTAQTDNPALNAAAVLALRERLTAQAEERRRLLAADEAALRVLDAEARIYDAAAVADAVREGGGDDDLVRWVSHTITQRVGGPGPWTRADVRDATADACDAILRRRAGGEP